MPTQQIYDRNQFHVKIFVCEYITGGGLYREHLPPSLAEEGELMLQALLADLGEIPGCAVLATRDARLPSLPAAVAEYRVDTQCADIWALWERCIAAADAVWPIAPESDGVLERLSRLAEKHGKCLLGSAPKAIAVAGSKHKTAAALLAAGVPTVPTFLPGALPQSSVTAWVAKPDDGVGCGETRCFSTKTALHDWLQEDGRFASHVVQPYVDGVPGSISMLCRNGQAWLLSCNRQDVRLHDGVFSFHGCVVNGLASHWQACERVATAVAAALPGLAGYVGVDILVTAQAIVVLEVNPRLTTSYAGLRRATGLNPARLVVDLLYNDRFTYPPDMTRQVVPITLHE